MADQVYKEYILKLPVPDNIYSTEPDFQKKYDGLNGVLEFFNILELDMEQKRSILKCINQFYGFE